jgi:exosortase E/protease (VPEID-CTERM system)
VLTDVRRKLPASLRGASLLARLALAGALLLAEKVVLSLFVDSSSIRTGSVVWVAQHWGFRFLVCFGISAAVFGYLRGGRELQAAETLVRAAPLRFSWLALHGALVMPLVLLSISLFGHATALPFPVGVALWLLFALIAVGALFTALAPWAVWRTVGRTLGALWWYAGVFAAGSVLAMGWSQKMWAGMATVTFEAVYRLLEWLLPIVRVDPLNRTIDTGHFAVAIDPVCSGLEGMGLMLAFCTVLLLLFRKEYLFPRAVLLIPAGVLLSFALNIVRISALVLIGAAGYSGIAVYGFHSQAGWIAFNGAAAGIAFVSLRSGWFTDAARRTQAAGENPTAAYLLPFLTLLLAGMMSRAMSSGFESLYGLRLVAAAVVLRYSLPRLRDLDWRISWRGPAVGLAAFAMWILAARLFTPPAAIPPQLAALPGVLRAAWVGVHLTVSLAVVPVAEELAFRGYLLRRIAAADFASVAPRSVGIWPLLLSSLVFGLCHGTLWLPGTLAGVMFALVFIRTQRIGETVAAHAVANALVAACVLGASRWELW